MNQLRIGGWGGLAFQKSLHMGVLAVQKPWGSVSRVLWDSCFNAGLPEQLAKLGGHVHSSREREESVTLPAAAMYDRAAGSILGATGMGARSGPAPFFF